VPESKVRKQAAQKKSEKRAAGAEKVHKQNLAARMDASRDWVPWVFVPCALLGVAWLVVYYIAGASIPFMTTLGNWNFLIGMVLIAASFMIATLWK